MDFLKEILGEELFNQLVEKINAHNGNEANKDNQVKLGNLGAGDYVAKGKHDSEIEKLNNLLAGKDSELTEANGLIEQLKKATKGNENLQGKITTYETTVADLQKQLQEEKVKAAIKVALLSEKAKDVDYLTFKLNEKLNEKGETLELDENDNIKGWDDKLSGLKTQFPTMFEAGATTKNVLGDNRLPGNDNQNSLTKDDLLKKPYAERMKIYNENPEAYREAMKN